MSHFTIENILFLFAGILMLGTSALAFLKQNEKLTLLFLFAGAFLLRMFIISLDPFLHNWDERFHALVAKNMMDDPFKPMLRKNPVLPYDYTDWADNHIWLHKQPLFLWQMALSMKIFGVNEMAIRFPSVLMGALQTVLIYRIGKLLLNRQVGFIAALLFSCSYFQLEQTCGMIGMDHNDVAFGFYITASIWCLFELKRSGKFSWVLLIGLFSGLAIMNKWLTGLVVYAGWGVAILADKKLRNSFQSYKEIAIAFLITCIIFIPWQIYIFNQFPVEAGYEFQLNAEHISKPIEGHRGLSTFYINKFSKEHFGYWAWLPLILGLFYIIRKSKRLNAIITLIPVAAIYIFFSLIVETKISGYTFAISSLVFVSIAAGTVFLSSFISQIRIQKIVVVILTIGFCFLNLSLTKISSHHFNNPDIVDRNVKISHTEIYKKLNSTVPEDYVIFNTPPREQVEAMFYSERNVYHFYPTREQYEILKQNQQKIAVFEEHHGITAPEYIQNDSEILIIKYQLK